jgi:hypothetical protein
MSIRGIGVDGLDSFRVRIDLLVSRLMLDAQEAIPEIVFEELAKNEKRIFQQERGRSGQRWSRIKGVSLAGRVNFPSSDPVEDPGQLKNMAFRSKPLQDTGRLRDSVTGVDADAPGAIRERDERRGNVTIEFGTSLPYAEKHQGSGSGSSSGLDKASVRMIRNTTGEAEAMVRSFLRNSDDPDTPERSFLFVRNDTVNRMTMRITERLVSTIEDTLEGNLIRGLN